MSTTESMNSTKVAGTNALGNKNFDVKLAGILTGIVCTYTSYKTWFQKSHSISPSHLIRGVHCWYCDWPGVSYYKHPNI